MLFSSWTRHFFCHQVNFSSHNPGSLSQHFIQHRSTLQTHKTVLVHFTSVYKQISIRVHITFIHSCAYKLRRMTCRISPRICAGLSKSSSLHSSRFCDVNFTCTAAIGSCGDDVLCGGLLIGWLLLQVFSMGLGCALRNGLLRLQLRLTLRDNVVCLQGWRRVQWDTYGQMRSVANAWPVFGYSALISQIETAFTHRFHLVATAPRCRSAGLGYHILSMR